MYIVLYTYLCERSTYSFLWLRWAARNSSSLQEKLIYAMEVAEQTGPAC